MSAVTTVGIVVIGLLFSIATVSGCQFYPQGEYLRFIRVPENMRVGADIMKIQVYPRLNLKLQAVDKSEDVNYFTYRDVNRTTVALVLARSLDDLVDTESPQNVLKFKLMCEYHDGEDTISSSLSVTVYVEDINDHAPVFTGTPYQVTVDELTPPGLTIFRGIRAADRDKPNTPNSDVQYAITGGNGKEKFALDNSHQAFLVLKRSLDFDAGDREFSLTVTASDRGVPPRSTNATVKVMVKDADDQPPKFTKGVYRTQIKEFYPITGERIHHRLEFHPPIFAFDQDIAIDAAIRYDILAGNDRHLFYLDHVNGSLFLEREIDLDAERSLPGNTFVLQIQASQLDNPLKTGVARVEVEVIDLNDNLPEFEVDFYNISIVENLPNGFSVLQIVATDQDQGDNGDFTYHLEDPSGAFTLDSRSGWLTVRDHSKLDREKRSTITMRVLAKEKTLSVITNKLEASSVNVEVTLLDANDNNPTFIPTNIYSFITPVTHKSGDPIGQVHAIDPDQGRNGMVLYSIQRTGNKTVPFRIDPRSGQISFNEQVGEGQHTILVEASDQPINPSERRYSLAVVTIDIRNGPYFKPSNKEVPEFVGAPYEFWVGGNAEVGTSIGQIRITDSSDRSHIMYDLLHSYHEGVPFAVEERTGTISVVDELDKFTRSVYDFEAVVTNERDLSIVTNVTMHIVNPQDEKTILMKGSSASPIEFHVKENKAGILIGKLAHPNITGVLKFVIANQRDVTDDISISTDGSIYTERALDREKRDIYRLTVLAEYSRGPVAGTGIYQVTVHVDDENDNAPHFEHKVYEGTIPENCKSGTEVELNYPVHAHDDDVGVNGQFTVTIFGEGGEYFRLIRHTGVIYFNSAATPLDREEKPVYNLRLVAKDTGGLYSEAKLIIKVSDINDNAPVFQQLVILPDLGVNVLEYDQSGSNIELREENSTDGAYKLIELQVKNKGKVKTKMFPLLSLPEDVAVGNPFLRLIAEDRDLVENAVIKYEMSSETYIPNELHTSEPFHVTQYFTIHATTGEVSVARVLPPESEFRLNISALDKGSLRDNITVRVYVRDVNDHPPVFKKSWYNFDTEETSFSRKVLGRIEATDSDFGQNANISYDILSTRNEPVPFTISKFSGALSVNGELDRETQDKYSFQVIAYDNPNPNTGNRLTSTVNVEVNVLDINDNSPVFYGYDDTIQYKLEDSEAPINHKFADSLITLPVYYANAPENSPIGTPVTRVFANDSDFSGNGNGLILYSIPHRKNKDNLFVIDSKEGIITTISKLDFERQKSHNLTVVASDLGSPSLSSTTLVVINVIDVPEDMKNVGEPIFIHRYYEVEVEENVPVPLKLLALNVTEAYRGHRLKYSIIGDKNSDSKGMFKIDPRNGTLYITKSPDREKRSLYELRIRLDEFKVGRDMTVMVYPVTNERLGDLGLNEVKVIVKITDVNDNAPKFTVSGRPLIAAIPSSANYGYQVVRLQARDPDLGLNGEVRYQILGRSNEEPRRFAIDSITGQVRAVSSFKNDAGRVYGFDVKATDRRGADDGKSAIANVFVYVLDDQRQLVMVIGSKPTDVEVGMDNITSALFNITGYDIRVRKLEPHADRNQVDNGATDMYLYAVDPSLNIVVDTEKLQRVLHQKQNEIETHLDSYKVLAFASGMPDRDSARSQRVLLSTLEVGVVVLGCVVFVGALATAVCVMCVRRRRNRILRKSFSHAQPLGYTLAPGVGLPKPLFPSAYGDSFQYGDLQVQGARDPLSLPGTGYRQQRDGANYQLYGRKVTGSRERSRSAGGIETSITSLHSSGQDSGIVDSSALHCPCSQSTSHSSEDSSNSSYEDSLNSTSHRHHRGTSLRHQAISASRNLHQRRIRNRSLSDGVGIGLTSLGPPHRTSLGMQRSSFVSHPHSSFLLPSQALRKSTERLCVSCPMNQ